MIFIAPEIPVMPLKKHSRSFGGEVKTIQFHQLRFDELEYMNRLAKLMSEHQCFDVE